MAMTDAQWESMLDRFQKVTQVSFDKQVELSEKFGGLAEGTKKELEALSILLNKPEKPLHKTFGFWKFIANILLAVLMVIFFGRLLMLKGGDFDGWGMKYSTCKTP